MPCGRAWRDGGLAAGILAHVLLFEKRKRVTGCGSRSPYRPEGQWGLEALPWQGEGPAEPVSPQRAERTPAASLGGY